MSYLKDFFTTIMYSVSSKLEFLKYSMSVTVEVSEKYEIVVLNKSSYVSTIILLFIIIKKINE